MVLDFIYVISELGVKVFWNNETRLTISIPTDISENLTAANISYKFTQILVPAILFRKGACLSQLVSDKRLSFIGRLDLILTLRMIPY